MTALRPAPEPMFNAPWPVLLVVASILLPYLLQSRLHRPDEVVEAFGLSSAALAQGRVWTLLTLLMVHGSWMHATLNALGALAFGAPVARRLGRGGGGRFLLFYLVCALLSSLGAVLLHWGQATVIIGASGAIYGLMGASSRLLDGSGRLAPFVSRPVLGMAGAWLVLNALTALHWLDAATGGAPVAWEAHLIGYATGLLLIGPFTPVRPRS